MEASPLGCEGPPRAGSAVHWALLGAPGRPEPSGTRLAILLGIFLPRARLWDDALCPALLLSKAWLCKWAASGVGGGTVLWGEGL